MKVDSKLISLELCYSLSNCERWWSGISARLQYLHFSVPISYLELKLLLSLYPHGKRMGDPRRVFYIITLFLQWISWASFHSLIRDESNERNYASKIIQSLGGKLVFEYSCSWFFRNKSFSFSFDLLLSLDCWENCHDQGQLKSYSVHQKQFSLVSRRVNIESE